MRIALACVLLALIAVPSAAAKTLRLDWREAYYPDYPRGHRITFRVSRVVVTRTGWTVHAAFTNGTPWRLRLEPDDPTGWQMGMGLVSPKARADQPWPSSYGSADAFRANRFQPRMPRSLAPGESWSGRFSGGGKLPLRRNIHVKFGRFVPPRSVAVRVRSDSLDWTTDHSFRL